MHCCNEDGAFDEAVKGVDAVAHTASPFHFQAEDPQGILSPCSTINASNNLGLVDLIVPAVKGTVGILKSIQKNAPGVQRVVVTSSVAVMDASKPTGTIYTEASLISQDRRSLLT